MEEKMLRKQIRRSFNPVGWSLVLYYLIMNIAVTAVVFVDVIIREISAVVSGTVLSPDEVMNSAMSNAWGYLLAGAVGMLVLFLWKGKTFWKQEIWAKGKPMTAKAFFAILVVFLGCQMAATIGSTILEMILNRFGLSIVETMEQASPTVNTLSLFLYMAVWAPFSEEILFRGVIQRLMLPHGKKFAIFASALLFGLFHGNLVQTPYAFLVGLILGYVASEYSIAWAMLLHMINNMLLGDSLMRVTQGLPESAVNGIILGLTGTCAVAGIIILAMSRGKIWQDLGDEKMDRRALRGFFSNAGVIVLTVMMVSNMILMLFMM